MGQGISRVQVEQIVDERLKKNTTKEDYSKVITESINKKIDEFSKEQANKPINLGNFHINTEVGNPNSLCIFRGNEPRADKRIACFANPDAKWGHVFTVHPKANGSIDDMVAIRNDGGIERKGSNLYMYHDDRKIARFSKDYDRFHVYTTDASDAETKGSYFYVNKINESGIHPISRFTFAGKEKEISIGKFKISPFEGTDANQLCIFDSEVTGNNRIACFTNKASGWDDRFVVYKNADGEIPYLHYQKHDNKVGVKNTGYFNFEGRNTTSNQ
ncbi:MAG TPA: hypothetical protein V6C58_12195 [Allocoleopsis sp.]